MIVLLYTDTIRSESDGIASSRSRRSYEFSRQAVSLLQRAQEDVIDQKAMESLRPDLAAAMNSAADGGKMCTRYSYFRAYETERDLLRRVCENDSQLKIQYSIG